MQGPSTELLHVVHVVGHREWYHGRARQSAAEEYTTAEHGIAQLAKLVLYTRNWQPEYMVRKLGLVAGLHLVVGYFLGKLEQADL